ncbi:MAG: transposase family protein, partial [Clostridiaceae bacterium]|nr:transposase family protein [Clostridiaceae bacterium]
ETLPGEQAQIDWKENIRFQLVNGEIININVLVLVLGYSRLKLYALSLSKKQSVLISQLASFFETLGGVPKVILNDNLTTVMDEGRTKFQAGVVNEKFLQFSRDMGFKIQPCVVGHPWTKGKVEASMKLLDDIHAYQGKLDFEGLVKLIERLNYEANYNINQATGHTPIRLFEQEEESLLPLPSDRIMTLYKIDKRPVKVGQDALINYKGSKYSVPNQFRGATLHYEAVSDYLYVYSSTKLICTHKISQKKINYLPEHYIDLYSKTLSWQSDIEAKARQNLNKIGEFYEYYSRNK